MKRALLLCCVSVAVSAAELPVTKVVLYKHGVGYFERSGELGPGESARLDFKASEMDDVLKSLTVASTGGKVTALRYDASEPVTKKLSRFPVQLDHGQPLSALLDQLKGEQVELRFGADTVRGEIIGARLQPATRESPEREQVTLLLATGEIVTRELSAASAVRFPDPKLEALLKDYLSVLAGARSQERRSVYLDSVDTARRRLRVSYMIPAPVWKSSYRLIIAGSAEPVLEGWAIVDNTTGDDWSGVRLALVSGRPISFISKLYEPRYVTRPEARLPEETSPAPVVHEGAIVGGKPGAASRSDLAGGLRRKTMALAEERQALPFGPKAAAAAGVTAPSSVAATARGRELGELFEYRFETPVTVRKNESAMLPFLQQKVTARKLLIYADRTTRHPLQAAELTNSTGKTLDGGPVTVFDAGAYAGEALMETLKAGDKRLISYGVDLGTRVTTALNSERARVREVHLRRGVLTARSAIRETTTYTIRNVDSKPKTLIIEHPVRRGYKLLDQTPAEKTSSAYRFEVKLAAGGTQKFAVTEERTLTNTYSVANQTPDLLASFVENKQLSETARQQLEQIVSRKREIAAAESDIRRIEKDIQELTADQNRIRQNISSLNRVSGQQEQVRSYAAQLARQEARLAELRDSLRALRKKKAALEDALNRLIENMEF